jgi:predicted RNA-binding protein associated with RNAse of E/G family
VWEPGDAIALREIWDVAVFEARPAVVVQDLPGRTMLYVPAGVVCGMPVDDEGRQLREPDRPWRLELRERGTLDIFSFAWPDVPYAVLLMLEPAGPAHSWYVNLQTPLRRTSIGFDTVDHILDVVIPLDRSTWTWKDEHELAEAIALGLFTQDDAASFRSWGERAVEHVLLRLPPFDQPWEDWRPDPSWPTPELPPGWDIP